MANKVKFGLSNVYYAVCTETLSGGAYTYTYGTPVAIPGAVNLSLAANGDQSVFRADNSDYWTSYNNNGYEGELEMALIPDSFKTDVLGWLTDDNSIVYEDASVQPNMFALMFQFEGDDSARRHVFYRCVCSRPDVASATTDTTITPVTETINIKASARLDNNVTKASTVDGDTTSTQYTNWFSSVYTITNS